MTHGAVKRKPRTPRAPKPPRASRVRKPRPFTYQKIYQSIAPYYASLKPGDKIYATPRVLLSPPIPGGFYVVPASGPTKKLPAGAKLIETVE